MPKVCGKSDDTISCCERSRSSRSFRFRNTNPFVTRPGPPKPRPVAVNRPRRSGSGSSTSSSCRMYRSVYPSVEPSGAITIPKAMPRSSVGTSSRGSRVNRKLVSATAASAPAIARNGCRRKRPSVVT